jgi:hypothetical protein
MKFKTFEKYINKNLSSQSLLFKFEKSFLPLSPDSFVFLFHAKIRKYKVSKTVIVSIFVNECENWYLALRKVID